MSPKVNNAPLLEVRLYRGTLIIHMIIYIQFKLLQSYMSLNSGYCFGNAP
jgi:hypothetical protein